jgi:hypothetical protein
VVQKIVPLSLAVFNLIQCNLLVMQDWKNWVAILLLAGLPTTIKAVPTYEAFLVTPQDVLKQTVVTKAFINRIDVTLTPVKSAEFLMFTKRNLGKSAIIGWLTVNKSTNRDLIQLTTIIVHTPVTDGRLHVQVSNPNWIYHDMF